MKFPLVLIAALLPAFAFAGDRAIYKTRTTQANIGNGNVTRILVSGFVVRDVDSNQATAIAGFTANGLKFFQVVPLQNHLVQTVNGKNGDTYTIMAKAESPGTQFAGTILESVFLRGKDSTITLGSGGPKRLPRLLSGGSRALVEVQGAVAAAESKGTMTLDLAASKASNISGESFDDAVERFRLQFVARGYSQITLPPAELD